MEAFDIWQEMGLMVAMAVENTACVSECYSECLQIKIFNEDYCNEECLFSCGGFALTNLDDSTFFPSWI
ncbi:hypothetical protein SASPL_137006 [Salvia splendens]|uniref:Uncharacterized protein n=1 Tax=Salvia splendens TaxID=180675 RepID=A0A8X8ZCT2_SALSN|nr:hypothetical protein SASPL_137006 [Salvia splendens]